MATSRKPAFCKGRHGQPGCGEQIRWVKNSKTLRPEPLDYEPTSEGNIVIEGGLTVHLSADRARAYEGEKFISHFATCPKASGFRNQKPLRAPARPKDIPLGAFDTPAAAAVGRMSADYVDLQADRLVGEFLDHAHEILGNRPTEDELQHVWKDWQKAKRNMGVDPSTLSLVAKRARAQLAPAEVTAA